MRRYVIIGNGGAAISAIRSIRKYNEQDQILLISKENRFAYSPMLIPYYLLEKITFKDIFLCDGEFYRKNNVQTILGEEAEAIDSSLKEVRLKGGRSILYDILLIATGSSPRLPGIEGIELPHVLTIRTLDDARRIKIRSTKAKSIILVGGGLVSLNMLNALYRPGLHFTLVIRSAHVLPFIIDDEGARIIEERLESVGIQILKRCDVRTIMRDRVILDDGSELFADLVIVGKGVRPNIDFLKEIGIQINEGIVVDESMRTNIKDIYAAGDVTETNDPISNKWQSNPTWVNAINQGKVAGLNMVGQKSNVIQNIRVNISSVFGLVFASFGYTQGEKEGVSIVRKEGPIYRKFIFKDNLLIGGILMNEVDDTGILLNFVNQRDLYIDLSSDLIQSNGFWPYCKIFMPNKNLKIKGFKIINKRLQ